MDEQIAIQNTQEEKSKILDLQKKQLLEEKVYLDLFLKKFFFLVICRK